MISIADLSNFFQFGYLAQLSAAKSFFAPQNEQTPALKAATALQSFKKRKENYVNIEYNMIFICLYITIYNQTRSPNYSYVINDFLRGGGYISI